MSGFGDLSLWMALLMAVWSSGLSALGAATARRDFMESGRRGLLAATAFTVLATFALAWAFVTRDFALRYVAAHSSDRVPVAYAVSAVWAAPAGVLLLGTVCFAISASITIRRGTGDGAALAATRGAMLAPVLACALGWIALAGRPFARLHVVPANGRGLEPSLQHWARVFDAPLLTMGCAAVLVWTLLALGSLGSLRSARRGAWRDAGGPWPHVAIASLTAGAMLRLWWTYARGGAVPSPGAIAESPVTAACVVLLLLAITVSLLAGAPGRGARRLSVAGAFALAVGFSASPFGREYDAALGDGETFRARDAWGAPWSFTSQGVSRIERPAYLLTSVALLPTRGAARQRLIAAGSRAWFDELDRGRDVPDGVPGLRRLLSQDVRVQAAVLDGEHAVLRIRFSPLVSCVWIGGVLLIAAELAALITKRGRRAVRSVP